MPKVPKKHFSNFGTQRLYASQPWSTKHYSDRTEIRAYSEISNKFETVLTAYNTGCHSAEEVSAFIISIVNEVILSESLMLRAMMTMQDFLIENDYPENTEQPVIDLIDRIKRTYGLQR